MFETMASCYFNRTNGSRKRPVLSLSLAKRIGGEIISADSMQVYKKMNIGTAKILPQQMEGNPSSFKLMY